MDELFDRIGGRYDKLVAQFGHDPRACDYGRAQSQAAKFKVLSEVLPLDGLSLLDVGCGFADYADFLDTRAEALRYTGIDLSEHMINEAKRLHPRLSLSRGNVLDREPSERFDVVNANGIFYLLEERAPELMRALISQMFAHCTRALAFNSLSSWAPAHEPNEYYADPLETVAFCRILSPRVVLRHDYLPHDFTIYLYRESR